MHNKLTIREVDYISTKVKEYFKKIISQVNNEILISHLQ